MSEISETMNELKIIHHSDAWHGPALLEVLNGVTFEQAAARPLPHAHSIWEIVLHIAGWEDVFRRRLEGEQASEPEEGDFPPVREVSEESWAEALAKLESVHERLLGRISELSDEMLEEQIAGRDYSVRFLLHGIVRHHVYHTGQIALLRKAFAQGQIE